METKEEKIERVRKFLEREDTQKYITAIEGDYSSNEVTLFIDHPEKGKYMEKQKFTPFIFMKDFKKLGKSLYKTQAETAKAMKDNGIKFRKLVTENHSRLEYGYKYIATSTKQLYHLNNFFKNAGYSTNSKGDHGKMFMGSSGIEQFLMSTGKRLFNGFKTYNSVHKFYFDIETTSLKPELGNIFMIGIKDNRGFQKVLEIDLNDPIESEKKMIIEFFNIIMELKPSIIAGYNSEAFDFYYILGRASLLGINIDRRDDDGNLNYDVRTSLNPEIPLKRTKATLKFGGETENYEKTTMWGMNVIDISHSVRATKAINSDIKGWGLKYITEFAEKNKPNRMYVKGDKIYKIWEDNLNYYINTKNNDYRLIPTDFQDKPGEYIPKLKNLIKKIRLTEDKNNLLPKQIELFNFFGQDEENVSQITGKEIIYQYLLDDLYETEMVDEEFNQSNFMMGGILPTNFVRAATMGNASKWKMLMTTYSYEHGLAIPITDRKRDIVGGLSRLIISGYAENVLKMDYKALYPSIQLFWDIFPEFDVTAVMEAMLTYFKEGRAMYQKLAKKHQKLYEKYGLIEDKELAALYKTKQLPIKILANSQFGALSSPLLFNWGDNNIGEEITCRGRQYLRLMIWHFLQYGFKPLVGDSVTHDTPVYIKDENGINIMPISGLFNEDSKFIDPEGHRDYEEKPYQVLTVNGWKHIKYVYRHETTKKIHRITTKDRLLNVTEDHSLFQNGVEVKPSTLVRGDKIDVYKDLESFNTVENISVDKAWLFGFFLGDGSSNISSRVQKYKSRKTGLININKGKRSDWKISNTRLHLLDKLQNILKDEYSIPGLIKDHLKSSGVYNLVVHNVELATYFCENFYTHYREKKVPQCILNASLEIKEAFIQGVCASDGYGDTIDECVCIGMKSQIAMAGLSLLFNELNIEYRIKTRGDKENFISFEMKHKRNGILTNFGTLSKKETDEVWKNDIVQNKDKNNYVYDISTEDGTFIAGIGLINAKNTDGFNFSIPNNSSEIKCFDKNGNIFTETITNEKTGEEEVIELTGAKAVLADFNHKYMSGPMLLDLEGIYPSTINIKRKNYADQLSEDKVKIVGNSLKSSTLQKYVETTFNTAIRMLLKNDGKGFIELYYSQIEKIFNRQIPLIQIAQKSKMKQKVKDYKYDLLHKTNKNGKPMARKAYMELLVAADLDPDLGQNIYYVNNGKRKSHGDIGNSYLVDEKDFIENPELTGEYNVPRYLDAFNTSMSTFLVCFSDKVRSTLLVTNPEKRMWYSEEEMQLVSGQPIESIHQDVLYDYEYDPMKHENEPVFEMSEREILFWNLKGADPKLIFDKFTTGLSGTPLLTMDEQAKKKTEEKKIFEFFKATGIEVKTEMEYLMDGDVVIKFSNKFIHFDEQTLVEKTEILDKMSWILSEFKYGVVNDLKVITEEIYSDHLEEA